MNKLDPSKLFVELRDGVTPEEPILGRKYTLTHSDTTAELYLTIGLNYAYDMVNEMRDEVLAEWRIDHDQIYLLVNIHVDNQTNPVASTIRNVIFVRELPLALEAIRFGDNPFFEFHQELKQAPIWISFHSIYPELDRFEYWGTPEDYI